MLSKKLLWTGLTLVTASSFLYFIPAINIVGEVFMIIGSVLLWLDK